MHSLSQLKAKLESVNQQIISFNGMTLVTEHGEWTMKADEYYLNNQHITRKEIKQKYFKCGTYSENL